jgi:polyisoprenoid-binding protein YceI
MQLPDGTIELSPAHGTLSLHTRREGFGASAGHDLTIVATRWSGVAEHRDGRIRVEITVEAESLEVEEGHGGVRPLGDSDRRDIETTMREKVLEASTHPRIVFRSEESRVAEDAQDRMLVTLTGTLELHGQRGPLEVELDVRREGDGIGVSGGATVVQSRWGIKPYRAFMGALKVADPVEVRVAATLPEAAVTAPS